MKRFRLFYAKLHDDHPSLVQSHHIHIFLTMKMRRVWLDKYKNKGAEIVPYKLANRTMKCHGGGYIHSIMDNIDSSSQWRYNK